MKKSKYELEIVKLGLVIRELREKENITQLQLAKLCEVDLKTIYRIEKGKQNFSITLLFSLADALKIDLNELIQKVFYHDK